MITRFASLALLLAAAAGAQPPAPSAVMPPPATTNVPRPGTVRVTLQTGAGPILIELEQARAPITVANFLRYVDGKRLDGASFYRATKVAPGFGLVQGGVGSEPKRALPPVAHEPTTLTGLHHDDGAIAMARNAPGSATGDFFIVVGGFPSMDADPAAPGDNQGFAVFGHVVGGMDAVRRILDAPTSPTKGAGVMKGQMLEPTVTITSARRSDPAPAKP